MILHAFTVDVEDWFHILDCPQMPHLEDYANLESRVENNTLRILDLLDEFSVKGTFFILGWVADQYPSLVQAIVDRGHEIGVHGYAHILASSLTDRELEEDTRRAVDAVANASGLAPVGYRSPGGSLLERHRWLLDLLIDLGIAFDASVYPRLGGLAEAENYPDRPYVIRQQGTRVLWEYPSTTQKALGIRWAFAEGGYLRLLPLPIVRRWFQQWESRGLSVSSCVHPREFDYGHPMLPLSFAKSWKTRVGLKGFESKVRYLLQDFQFCSIGQILKSLDLQQSKRLVS